MAKRMKSAVAATVVTVDPTLPAGAVPLRWGPPWPSVDARLYISGISGVWAYAGHVEYGRNRYVEVVEYAERGVLWKQITTRFCTPIERVFVLADGEAQP